MQIESSKLLSVSQKAIFARAKIAAVAEVWLQAASDIAKKTRVSVEEVQAAVDLLCTETAPTSLRVTTDEGSSTGGGDVQIQIASRLTTGDNALDAILGGGIEAQSVTEIVGEAWVVLCHSGSTIDQNFAELQAKVNWLCNSLQCLRSP
jgi:Rad51